MNDSLSPGSPGSGDPTPGRRAARPVDDDDRTRPIVVGDDSRVREVRGTRDARSGDVAPVRDTRGDTVQRPAVRREDHPVAPTPAGRVDPSSGDRHDHAHEAHDAHHADRVASEDHGRRDDGDDEGSREPVKPVGTALSGFFTGMLYVLVLPVLWWVLSDPDSPADLFSADLVFFAPAILVPVALAVAPRTRRFGRYMLLGVGLSGVVVVGVAALVLAFLIVTGR